MSHRIKSTHRENKTITMARDANAPAWPSYQGTSQLVGTSPSGRVTVYVDPSLGQQALQNAQDLLKDADRVVNANDGLFGTTGGPVSVILFALGGATDGTGGADHNGCDYTTGNAIEVDVSYGNSARVSALFEAELSECSMNGNLCGESTGEALSRWCAAVIGNNALADFATAPQWVADGMPDYVNRPGRGQHRLRRGIHLLDDQPGIRSRKDCPGNGESWGFRNAGRSLRDAVWRQRQQCLAKFPIRRAEPAGRSDQ